MRIGRVAWGGPSAAIGASMPGPATSITVHHTLQPALPAGVTMMQERMAVLSIHRDHASRWAGIGYNFVITQNGNVYEGRGWGRVGAHAGTTEGNRTSAGIAFLIDGRSHAPTPAAMEALTALRAEGIRVGQLLTRHGVKLHRDWRATECPGERVIAALRDAVAPTPVVLRRGDRGDDVQALQALLVRLGYMSAAQMASGPGIYGPQTAAAFAAFIQSHR
jgi:peptidoglycan recognition protein